MFYIQKSFVPTVAFIFAQKFTVDVKKARRKVKDRESPEFYSRRTFNASGLSRNSPRLQVRKNGESNRPVFAQSVRAHYAVRPALFQ